MYPRLGAGEVKTPALGSGGNKRLGFRRLPVKKDTFTLPHQEI